MRLFERVRQSEENGKITWRFRSAVRMEEGDEVVFDMEPRTTKDGVTTWHYRTDVERDQQ